MTLPTILCKHCTVPVTGSGDVCTFCRTYTPPNDPLITALADSYTSARATADQLGALISMIPGDAPLWSVVDLTGAAAHLRAAQRLIDRAATRVTAGEAIR